MGSSPPLILRGSGRLTSARSVREATPLPENQLLLTKGDNNYLDDIELYQGLDWLEHKHIVGKVRGCVIARRSFVPAQTCFFLDRFLPYVGYVTIALVRGCVFFRRRSDSRSRWQNDFPQLKYALLGGLGLLALIQRE